MMIQNGEFTLNTLFDGTRVLTVPQYQRRYAWEVEHVETLFDDLMPSSRSTSTSYYLGTLLLEEEGEQDGYTQLSIVDGQQRLTSVVILVSVLLRRVEDLLQQPSSINTPSRWKLVRNTFLEYEGVPKFHTVGDDDAFFRDHIIGPDEPVACDTPSKHRLWAAKRHLMGRVKSCDATILLMLLQRIQSSRVLVFAVRDRGEATQIFELNNDRGKRLTQLEAVKSFSMHHVFTSSTGSKAERDDVLKVIEQRFNVIYRELEHIEEAGALPAEEGKDAFLRYHWIAFEDWKELTETKALFKEKVRSLEEGAVVRWIDEFSRHLKKTFEIVATLLRQRHESEMLGGLYALARMGNFYPLLIKAYDQDSGSRKESFSRVVRLLEMFSFRAYGIGNLKVDTGRSNLYRLARDFKGDFGKLIVELKRACTDAGDWGVGQRFEKGLGSAQMYNEGRDALYLLWRYENYLRRESGKGYPRVPLSAFLSSDSRERLTIEHVAAQKADPVPSYKVELQGDDETFRKEFLHALGNLVIDSFSPNAGKGKDPFLSKEHLYQGSPFMSQQELSKFARKAGMGEAPIWDKEVIQSRGEDLRRFALDEWDPERV
jgi:hypothetical protein